MRISASLDPTGLSPEPEVPIAIRIQCPVPACGAKCSAADTVSGRTVKCPKCGKPFVAQATLDGISTDTKKSRPTANGNPFPELPVEFGRYRVLKLLGRGGMGAVYLAQDSQLGRQVALKIPFFDATQSQRIERFAREARSAASLHHPNICTVFDSGEIGGRPFITMAFVPGTPLDRMIDPDAPMAPDRAAEIVRQAALALGYAHKNGVVHRDLKPANIMITAEGEPVVMDFGLAKQVGARPDGSRLTNEGGILGTPSYMSPEQANGDDAAIGPATDVYALGVVLFELLTGTPPYVGGLGAVLGQIVAAPIPSVNEFRPDADPRLDAVCQRAMAKNPADRFRDMAELASALGAFLSATESDCDVELVAPGGAAAPVPAPAPAPASAFEQLDAPTVTRGPKARRQPNRTTSSSDATVAEPRAEEPGAPGRRGKPWWIAAAVLVPLAVVVVAAVMVLRVETPNGTLVVEIDDPAVEARIKNGKLILSGPDGKDRYTLAPGERNTKIDAGPYKVRVEGADGLMLDTPEFTLKKGDKVTVRVTAGAPIAVVKKDPPAVKKEVPNLDQDRKAAEYVLSVGGAVRVDDEARDIKVLGDLPPGTFRLTGVLLNQNQFPTNGRPSDEGLANFKNCTEITHLDLTSNHTVGDAGVANFKNCKKLKHLELAGLGVTDKGIAHFKGNANLVTLSLAETKITNEGLIHFEGCTGLRNLALNSTRVTDAGLKHFRQCKEIWYLRLHGLDITDEGLSNFKECSEIRDVFAGGTGISDKGVAYLTNGKKVELLLLPSTAVTDGAIDAIKQCKFLRILDLQGTKVSAKGTAELMLALPKCQFEGAKPPAAPKGDGYVPLFNGKDGAGWWGDSNPDTKAAVWTVKDGNITTEGTTAGALKYLEPTFLNFHLRVEAQVSEGDKSAAVLFGAGYRCNLAGPNAAPGDLFHIPGAFGGQLKSLKAADAQGKPRPGQWYVQEIIVKGNTITVLIDGKQVLSYTDVSKQAKASAIYLWSDGAIKVAIRKIEIKELTEEKKEPPAKKDPPADPFQEGSVWVGNGTTLTVTERKGATFKAKFVVVTSERLVSGTVKDGKVSWLAKDVVAVKGTVGGDNQGTIAKDKDGDLINCTYQQGAASGMFVLRLQPGK